MLRISQILISYHSYNPQHRWWKLGLWGESYRLIKNKLNPQRETVHQTSSEILVLRGSRRRGLSEYWPFVPPPGKFAPTPALLQLLWCSSSHFLALFKLLPEKISIGVLLWWPAGTLVTPRCRYFKIVLSGWFGFWKWFHPYKSDCQVKNFPFHNNISNKKHHHTILVIIPVKQFLQKYYSPDQADVSTFNFPEKIKIIYNQKVKICSNF